MLRFFLFLAALAIAPVMSYAQNAQMVSLSEMPSGHYVTDPAHTSLTWKVSHMGLSNYTARFTKVSATLQLDAKNPTQSTLVAKVDPMSVKTDFPDPAKKDFDKELSTGKDWFNAGQFPDIKFESTSIDKTGDKTGKLHGNLTFLGVTKPLTLDVTFNGAYLKKPVLNEPGMGFSATAGLKRSEWGFSTYLPMLGDEVQLLIETEFAKAP